MKSCLKKGKPVIEMHAPERRALETAKAVCDFILCNTKDEATKETATIGFACLSDLLVKFAEEPKPVKPVVDMAGENMLTTKEPEKTNAA